MNVLLLTVFLSLLLAGVFLLCFIRDQRGREGSAEQDSLRPFDPETPKSHLSK